MKCMVYPFIHQRHTGVIVPSSTDIELLPKAIRHEIDTQHPLKQIDLQPGLQLGRLDEDQALQDIRTEGYHLQTWDENDEMMSRVA